MKGKIISWKEDKGFGFISTDDKSEKIFFHISSVKKATRKPEVGDDVVFEVAKDSQGRLKATHLLLEGVALSNNVSTKKIITDPVKKDAIDYFIILVLVLLLASLIKLFVQDAKPESAMMPGIVFIIVLMFLFARKKQPANKFFSCSKCRTIANHDKRTVLAWNRGLNRLYCKSCHQQWLRDQPIEFAESRDSYSSPSSGCFGLFFVITFIPILGFLSAIKWFV